MVKQAKKTWLLAAIRQFQHARKENYVLDNNRSIKLGSCTPKSNLAPMEVTGAEG
jgi:glycine cleavage system protein P-like pyridoxal-binding family